VTAFSFGMPSTRSFRMSTRTMRAAGVCASSSMSTATAASGVNVERDQYQQSRHENSNHDQSLFAEGEILLY
jgi:hypothetical protein